MKKQTRNKIDDLAHEAIAERVASVKYPESVPLPVFRGAETQETAYTVEESRQKSRRAAVAPSRQASRQSSGQMFRRYASPFNLVAAALVCCLILPPLAVGRDARLSHISAAVHSRGEIERCRMAAIDIISLAAQGQHNSPRR